MDDRRRLVLILASALVVCVLAFGTFTMSAPVAHADALCGDQPAFWDWSNWWAWEQCEIAGGNPAAPLTNITSPLLGQMVSGLQGVTDAVNALNISGIISSVAAVPGAVVSGVVAFFTPASSDWSPVTTALADVDHHQPFLLIGTVMADAASIRGQWIQLGGNLAPFAASSVSGSASEAITVIAPTTPDPLAAPGLTQSPAFGPLSGGVGIWLWFMAKVGMSQSTVAGLFSFFIICTTVYSILADLGVRMGQIAPGSLPMTGKGEL